MPFTPDPKKEVNIKAIEKLLQSKNICHKKIDFYQFSVNYEAISQ